MVFGVTCMSACYPCILAQCVMLGQLVVGLALLLCPSKLSLQSFITCCVNSHLALLHHILAFCMSVSSHLVFFGDFALHFRVLAALSF